MGVDSATTGDSTESGYPPREVAQESAGPVEGDLERAIAGQVRAYRTQAGISVGEMAERIGIG